MYAFKGRGDDFMVSGISRWRFFTFSIGGDKSLDAMVILSSSSITPSILELKNMRFEAEFCAAKMALCFNAGCAC
jgi:hypothetical protein